MASDGVISLGSVFAADYMWLVGKTSHWTFKGVQPVRDISRDGGNAIFAFWHNRFIVMPYVYRYYFHKQKIAVIVSQSRDGELVGRFLDRYRLRSIRGSSSKGGKGAMLNLLRSLKDGWDVALTPDGPRGPRYQVQDGIIALASASGVPIIPVSYASSLRFVFWKSWDHFRLPLPGSRIKMVFEEPIRVGKAVKDDDRKEIREELRRRLRRADREAETVV